MSLASRRIEYETAGLDRDQLLDDPIAQWQRWYDEAVEAGVTEPDAFALATSGADGLPDVRFVLVRGVDERGFTFFTNHESVKGRQLAEGGHAAGVFGWLGLHRQVRLAGRAERIDDAESDAYFASRPRGSRLGAWASAQSQLLAGRDELERRVAEVDARYPGDDVPRPPFWGGWRIVPARLEFWQGRPSRLHDRFRYTRDAGGWRIDRLYP